MGKGLGIQREGVHIAFVAGTGVLVFVDLVAYLIRQNLGKLERSELHPTNFKFILYASFATKQDAVGLELLEGLQEITQKQHHVNFELVLRYSN